MSEISTLSNSFLNNVYILTPSPLNCKNEVDLSSPVSAGDLQVKGLPVLPHYAHLNWAC